MLNHVESQPQERRPVLPSLHQKGVGPADAGRDGGGPMRNRNEGVHMGAPSGAILDTVKILRIQIDTAGTSL
jgi:hypothetical protein